MNYLQHKDSNHNTISTSTMHAIVSPRTKNGSIELKSPKEKELQHYSSFYDFMKEKVAPGLAPGLNWIEVHDDCFMHPCEIRRAHGLSDIEKYVTSTNSKDWNVYIGKRCAKTKKGKELNKVHDLKINQYENRPNWVWALVGNVIGDHPLAKKRR